MKLKKVSIQIDHQQNNEGLKNFIKKSDFIYDDSAFSFITVIVPLEHTGNFLSDVVLYKCVLDVNVLLV